MLTCAELGTSYRALSADATTALGLSPAFVIHDELGAITGPRSQLFEAMELATAAQDDPLSIVISTQAASDTDLLSILIDDALSGGDPRTTVSPLQRGEDARSILRGGHPRGESGVRQFHEQA